MVTLGAPIALTAVQSVQNSGSAAKVVTFDTNAELVNAIKAGDVQWAVDQQPFLQGYLAVDALWLYLNNRNIIGGGMPTLTGPAFIDQVEHRRSRRVRQERHPLNCARRRRNSFHRPSPTPERQSFMTSPSIGVAVIGGGMAGRAHAAGYRTATTLFGTDRPDVRLVAIADTNAAVADDTAKRYGYDRAEYDWHAIADAPDIDAVSVVVANHLHREIVEGLLAAGKHVLCEKPLAGSLADAEAMVAAAERSDRVTAVGYTYRRSPAVEAIRRELAAGTLGELVHFNGHYWCDYALDPTSPITWRYRGGPGTGALADVGSHLLDLSEFICGPISEVSGATFTTVDHPSPRSPRCHLRPRQGCGQRRARCGGKRGCRHFHGEVRKRRCRNVFRVPGGAQPTRRSCLRAVRIQRFGGVGSAPRRRIPDLDRRCPQRHRRPPAGAHRP